MLSSEVSLTWLVQLLVFAEFVVFDTKTRSDIGKRVIIVTKKSNIAV